MNTHQWTQTTAHTHVHTDGHLIKGSRERYSISDQISCYTTEQWTIKVQLSWWFNINLIVSHSLWRQCNIYSADHCKASIQLASVKNWLVVDAEDNKGIDTTLIIRTLKWSYDCYEFVKRTALPSLTIQWCPWCTWSHTLNTWPLMSPTTQLA